MSKEDKETGFAVAAALLVIGSALWEYLAAVILSSTMLFAYAVYEVWQMKKSESRKNSSLPLA